jgi:hypothetical protein
MPVKSNRWGDIDFIIRDIDTHTSYGTGLGISATIPVFENIFVLATVSGLYLFGNQKVDIDAVKMDPGGIWYEAQSLKTGYNQYGVNANLSLAYYISEWSTVISLGGRFQYIIADYDANSIHLDSVRFLIYGLTLTATYSFSL